KHKWHYIIENVPNRSLILFHSANHAQKELLGCIAPVTKIIKEGIGEQSRKAMQRLMEELEKRKINGTVKLVIKKKMIMNKMNVIDRATAPTPKFFKIVRTVGLVLASIGGSLLAAPVAIPLSLVNIAGYLTVAGGVLSAVAQITVDENQLKTNHNKNGNH